MVMSRDQNAGRNHSVRMDNSTFERVEEFKYLGTTLKNQNSILEEIKSRLRSGRFRTGPLSIIRSMSSISTMYTHNRCLS